MSLSSSGIGEESPRAWVKKVDIEAGVAPGTTTGDAARIRELELVTLVHWFNEERLRLDDAYAAAWFGSHVLPL